MTVARRRRALLLLCAVVTGALAAGCSDDEKPLEPGTGDELETPTSQMTPPSSLDQ